MDKTIVRLIQTVHKTSLNPRNSEATRALAREARTSLTEVLKLYKNPKTRDQATALLNSLGEKEI